METEDVVTVDVLKTPRVGDKEVIGMLMVTVERKVVGNIVVNVVSVGVPCGGVAVFVEALEIVSFICDIARLVRNMHTLTPPIRLTKQTMCQMLSKNM